MDRLVVGAFTLISLVTLLVTRSALFRVDNHRYSSRLYNFFFVLYLASLVCTIVSILAMAALLVFDVEMFHVLLLLIVGLIIMIGILISFWSQRCPNCGRIDGVGHGLSQCVFCNAFVPAQKRR